MSSRAHATKTRETANAYVTIHCVITKTHTHKMDP